VRWPQVVFGVLLVVGLLALAVVVGWWQVRALRRLRGNTTLPPDDLRYERGKAWRRLLSSVLTLVLAGLLAGALVYLEGPAQHLADERADAGETGEELPAELKPFARLYGYTWLVVLLVLMLWVVLAGVDLWATRRWGLRQQRKLQADRRAMIERQAARLRSERNGHG
jgi:hypothetical protein